MSRLAASGEYEHEAEPGLPEALPEGERLLWRGTPDWRVLARRGFRLRWFAAYFAVLVAWRFASTFNDGGWALALKATAWTLPLAALALGFIAVLAWLVQRTTMYTITNRRVVMRIGIVLTVTFNLPFKRIEAARLHALADGSGDISLLLKPEDRIGWLHLWPHARPWHVRRTEPMLRALRDVKPVAQTLAQALAEAAATAAPAPEAPATIPVRVPHTGAPLRPRGAGPQLPHAA